MRTLCDRNGLRVETASDCHDFFVIHRVHVTPFHGAPMEINLTLHMFHCLPHAAKPRGKVAPSQEAKAILPHRD